MGLRSRSVWPRRFTVVRQLCRQRRPAKALVAKIEGDGAARPPRRPISDPAVVARLVDTAESAFGRHRRGGQHAGIMQLATISRERRCAVSTARLRSTSRAVFNTLREASRRLRAGPHHQHLVERDHAAQPTYGVYAATKAAVEAMTSVLTKELRGRNIHRNANRAGADRHRLFRNGKPQE